MGATEKRLFSRIPDGASMACVSFDIESSRWFLKDDIISGNSPIWL
jgi:hypothetical protein